MSKVRNSIGVLFAVTILFICVSLSAWQSQETAQVDLYGDPLPPGAIARLGTLAYRHFDDFQCVGILNDNKTIALVTYRGELQLINALDGSLTKRQQLAPGIYVQAAVITTDRKFVAVHWITDTIPRVNRVALFDMQGQAVRKYDVTDRNIQEFAISPDHSLIAVQVARDLRIVDLKTGKQLGECQPGVRSGELVFTPDSQRLIFAGHDNLFIWDWSTDEPFEQIPFQLNARNPRARHMAFSPSGDRLAISFGDRIGVAIFEVNERKFRQLTSGTDRDFGSPRFLQFLPDGSRLAASFRHRNGNEQTLLIIDSRSGNPVKQIVGSTAELTPVSISADGSLAVTTSDLRGQMGAIDWDTLEPINQRRPASQGLAGQIVFLGFGRQVATAGDDRQIRIWETDTGKNLQTLKNPHLSDAASHARWIRGLAASHDGRLIASSSLDDSVCVWELPSGRLIYRLAGHGRTGGTRALAFNHDATHLSSFGDDLRIYVWDVGNGKAVEEFSAAKLLGQPEEPNRKGLSSLERFHLGHADFTSDAKQLLIYAQARLNRLDISRRVQTDISHANPHSDWTRFAVSNDKEYLVSSGSKRVTVVGPDGRETSRRGTSHRCVITNIESGEVVQQFELVGENVGPVAFSNDGRRIAASVKHAHSSAIHIYSAETGRQLTAFTDITSEPWVLKFSPDDTRLATAMRNGNVLIWDVSQLK